MSKHIFLLVVLSMLVTTNVVAQNETIDRKLFPHYPSLFRLEENSSDFTAPEACGGCHPDKFEEWSGSVHALAFQDPVYQGELNKAFKAKGPQLTKQCEGCHTPAGMMNGETRGAGISGLSDVAFNGVSCDICHSVSGTTHWQTPSHEPENGSLVLSPGKKNADGDILVKRGPFPPSEDCGMGFHECKESPLHLSAELCAGCHQVYHHDKHFPLEATYLEWKHGPYAQRGIACQDCHMVETDTFLRVADQFEKPQREDYRHYFNGANYLLYYLAKSAALKRGDEDLANNLDHKFQMAVKRLQSAAAIEMTPVYLNKNLNELKVRVKNLRAGHNLPTSLTNVRQMWLEVIIRDGTGRQILSAGMLDENGRIEKNARFFNSEGRGDDFHFAIDPWIVTSFSRHDTIPPRGYKDIYYGVPADLTGEIIVNVRLRYRQADQKVAEKLLNAVPEDIDLKAIYGLKQIPELPIVDMVTLAEKFPTNDQ